ncbi:MAG: WecB/TagA/CpsF family glycosyltransferase [Paraprevotella sp.]|nr:WecB/TagA/CpsF family glycosyltransferase [Paraprevotella sp.]
MFLLKDVTLLKDKKALGDLPKGKLLINTINAHSYNTALKDNLFAEALTKGDVLIPDGASIVKACRWLKAKSQPTERIAGWDLFMHEMEKINGNFNDNDNGNFNDNDNGNFNDNGNDCTERKGRVMFMGSSEMVLGLIRERAAKDYPNIEIVTYSPPYKAVFTEEDNRAIIEAINKADPDLLWIGMTAPKQEKWTYEHWNELKIHCHVGTIGAVFDFYAGTVKRAPIWWQEHGLEWLYRLLKEPRRMWRWYIIGNTLFLWNILKEYRRR